MRLIFLFVSTLLIFSSGCKRKNNSSNSNYLNCKINGIFWEPDKHSGIGEYPLKAVLLGDSILDISAMTTNQTVHICVVDASVVAINYPLNNNLSHTNFGVYDDNNLSSGQYVTDSLFQGTLCIINLDKSNMTVAGTFHFKAYNTLSKDSISITDGKFSIKYSIN